MQQMHAWSALHPHAAAAAMVLLGHQQGGEQAAAAATRSGAVDGGRHSMWYLHLHGVEFYFMPWISAVWSVCKAKQHAHWGAPPPYLCGRKCLAAWH
jgi:hypothetical protein